MLLVPSLKPNRLRGVCAAGRGRGGLAEAQLRPADRDRAEADPGQVADRVHGDLRIVRAGLHAQVAAAAAGSSLSPGKCGRSASAAGRRSAARSGPGRPARTATGRSRRSASAGTAAARAPRRCRPAGPRRAAGRAARRPRGPAVIRRRPRVQSLQQPDQFGAVVGRHVERGEVQPVLHRRWRCRLVAPWKATAAPAGGGRRRRRPSGAATRRPRPPAAAAPSASPAPPQPSSERRRRARRPLPSAAASSASSRPVTHDGGGELGQRLGERVRPRRTAPCAASAPTVSYGDA